MIRKVIPMLGLLLGIAGALSAQQNAGATHEDEVFELPNFSIRNAWHIDLGKGNYLELELTDRSQLPRFQNVDSLLMAFLADMKPFQDSLADPVTGKRIDYLIDSSGRKMVRIHETRPSGASYLLEDDQPSLLRMKQDTIYILLGAPAAGRTPPGCYDRLTVVINRYDQLQNLITAGLNDKIRELGKMGNRTYDHDFGGGGRMVSDHTITIKREGIYASSRDHNFLELDEYADIQNYKNYFVPSVGLGATIGLRHGFNVNTFGLHWEPYFLFGADAQGHLQTYRNDLLVLDIAHDRTDQAAQRLFGLNTNLSLGWFVHREGNYFTGASFRLSAFGVQMKKGFSIQPCIYFNDLFSGVTPGLRLSFKFL